MPTISVNNVWSHVEGAAPKIHARLLQLEAGFAGYGLRKQEGNAFLTGVLPLVVDNDNDVEMYDRRTKPNVPVNLPAFLRPYQRAAVEKAISATRGVIRSPTGSGKTAMGAGLIAALNIRWVYLVPAPSLAMAVAAWLRKHLKEPVGELHGSVKNVEGRILVTTYDTLQSHPDGIKFLTEAQGLIVDEVHRAAMNTAMKCILNAENAYYRIGLSATPLLRSDGRNPVVIGLIGPVIHEITVAELEAAGHTSPLEFIWVPAHQPTSSGRSFNDFYEELIVNSIGRNKAIGIMADALPVPAIIFVKRKEHAELVYEEVTTRRDPDKVAIVDGDVHPKERAAIAAKMRTKEIEIVIATKVFYEGIDIPELAAVFVATGYKSAIEAIQRAGRGSRTADGKEVCYIIEFADTGHRWLTSHTLARYQAYKDAGYNVPHPFGGDAPTPKGTWLIVVLLAIVLAFYVAGSLR